MEKAARKIVAWLVGSRLSFLISNQVREDLERLHPGEPVETYLENYYVRKVKLILLILVTGLLLGAGALASARKENRLAEGKLLQRGDYREGPREVILQTPSLKNREFTVTVYPTELPDEEKEVLAESFLENIETYILGKNQDLTHVYRDLNLLTTYEGIPFTLEWESNRQDLLDDWGSVGTVTEAATVLLQVTLGWGDYRRSEKLPVVVIPFPRSTEEVKADALEELLLAAESKSREEAYVELPGDWEGSTLSWKQRIENYSLLIWTVTPAIAVLLFWMADRDLHKELLVRQEHLRREYPGVVNRLILYLGAGLSLRSAFERLAKLYEDRKTDSPAGREILLVARQLRAGLPEGGVYEHFGRRAGVREYMRLSALLLQNQRRGNSALLDRLRQEADTLSGEKLLDARKLGEEAGTKLLFPMVMLLGTVMVMIMIPAFGVI